MDGVETGAGFCSIREADWVVGARSATLDFSSVAIVAVGSPATCSFSTLIFFLVLPVQGRSR
jgi:hypothetical protein